MRAPNDTARGYIRALLGGSRRRAATFLSPGFGRHGGRDADAHLSHELAEFARLGAAYHLEKSYEIVTRATDGDGIACCLLDARGRLVCEDTVHFGPDGLVRGDQSPFETVPKLVFDGEPSRAVALRAPGRVLRRVVPMGVRATDVSFGREPGPDSFHTCRFRIEKDVLRGHRIGFRVHCQAGVEGLDVFMPGRDHPFFVDGLFPELKGSRVGVPKERANFWLLEVTTTDGRTRRVSQPCADEYVLKAPVRRAVLTDALDHQWAVGQ